MIQIKKMNQKKKRKSIGLFGKKKNKKKLIAAEMIGKLKKTTHYTKFEIPLYILPLNVAELKKAKDEKYAIKEMGLQIGYKIELKQKGIIYIECILNLLFIYI